MPVYKPAKSPFYHFDFQLQGRRFHGSTRMTNQRAAERVEEQEREAAAELLAEEARMGHAPMTIDIAAGRYWLEVGKHHAASKDTRRALKWLVQELGPDTLVAKVDDSQVAEIVAKRRGHKVRGEPIANATVNRTCTEALRKLLNRARDVWGQTIQPIRWERHMLPERKEITRELTGAEEAKLDAAIRDDYRPLYRFAILTGMRASECLRLTWQDVDWGNRLIRVHGKGGKVASIPLEPDVRDLLFPLQGRHPISVFCYQAARTRGGRTKGEWLPVTRSGLKTRWRRDRAASGVTDYRWHDHRHTAATRVLRASGNIKAVQKLLRHSDIATTTKYAHVTDNDLRDALNAAAESRNKSRTAVDEAPEDIDNKGEANG